MKHAFYFRFYRMFHNEALCCFLASLAYFLFCVKFFLKKAFRKKVHSTMTVDEAHKIINEVYPKPESNPEYINPEIDETLDLSIVIPVYNYADILEDNIKSILNQKTDYRFEAIFVDDGSTDGAQDILRKYENHPNVKLIFQQNGGIGVARNTGVNNANGKYLMFVDCDDGYKNGDEIMNLPGLPWAKVYRRELWNNVRFFPGYWYEDTIVHPLIFTQVKSYAYIPKIVYEYKWYEKNFSHTQNDSKRIRTIERYWILEEIIERYNSLNLPKDAKFYTLLLKHYSTYYYPFIKGLDSEVVEALFVLAKEEIDRFKPKEKVKLPYVLKFADKAFSENDLSLWQISSCYQ